VTTPPTIERAAAGIREELELQVAEFEEQGKLLEAIACASAPSTTSR